MRRIPWLCMVVFALLPRWSLAPAVALPSAGSALMQGYAFLAQARAAGPGESRERFLSKAVRAFKRAYRVPNRHQQVQALLGSAQSYLLMQAKKQRFPFLWNASPLQRAEKSLLHALVLQPGNAAAALLLGLVSWKQAQHNTTRRAAYLARSRQYLLQAAALGVPLRLSGQSRSLLAGSFLPFEIRYVLVWLQYLDLRGKGKAQDLVLVYRPPASKAVCFGVVVTEGNALPLVTNTTTRSLLPTATLQHVRVVLRRGGAPLLVFSAQRGKQHLEARFQWRGNRLVSLGRP